MELTNPLISRAVPCTTSAWMFILILGTALKKAHGSERNNDAGCPGMPARVVGRIFCAAPYNILMKKSWA